MNNEKEIKVFELINEETTDGSILEETKRTMATLLGRMLLDKGLITFEKQPTTSDQWYICTARLTVKLRDKEVEDND